MRTFTLWLGVLLASFCFGCNDNPDLTTCPGGACETQEECEMDCEDVCGSPDFLSFRCVNDACQCECFFGCQ